MPRDPWHYRGRRGRRSRALDRPQRPAGRRGGVRPGGGCRRHPLAHARRARRRRPRRRRHRLVRLGGLGRGDRLAGSRRRALGGRLLPRRLPGEGSARSVPRRARRRTRGGTDRVRRIRAASDPGHGAAPGRSPGRRRGGPRTLPVATRGRWRRTLGAAAGRGAERPARRRGGRVPADGGHRRGDGDRIGLAAGADARVPSETPCLPG